MANGRQRLSEICRPLAEPMTITYLSSRFSTTVAVRPVSPIVRGSLGRKLSSDKIDASRPPAGAAVATAVIKRPHIGAFWPISLLQGLQPDGAALQRAARAGKHRLRRGFARAAARRRGF